MRNAAVLESLEAKWKQDPQSRVFFRFADELRKAQQYDRAIEVCEQGLKFHSQYLPALICLGRCYENNGELERAAELYRRILAQDPNNPHALHGMSLYLESSADFKGAVQFAEALSLLQPTGALQERIEMLKAQQIEAAASQDSVAEVEAELSLDDEIEAREQEALSELEPLPFYEAEEAGSEEKEHSFNTLPTVQFSEEAMAADETDDSFIDLEPLPDDVSTNAEVEEDLTENPDLEDHVDAEFEKGLNAEPDIGEALGDLDSLDPSSEVVSDLLTNEQVEQFITRALKHEKMEHYEEASIIYRDLMPYASRHPVIQLNLDRVNGMLDNESVKARKIRSLNIWLEKIKGVYHVS